MDIKNLDELSKLSVPEKILLVEDIWDSIVLQGVDIHVPDSHKKELDDRHKKYIKSPGKLLSIEELQAKIDKNK